MAGPQEFNDTDSARGQGPTQATSYWIPNPGSHPGEAAGGTENLRADAQQHGPSAKGASGSGERAKVSGVQSFNDGTV